VLALLTPPQVEIPLSEITYIDNQSSMWNFPGRIHLRTTYEKCYSFDVPKKISNQIVETVEAIVRQLRPERFLPVTDPRSSVR
jgi:hypothetical protein